ncbi:unnamed protein product [Pneumocystis jirovecii]|uniref:Uncharacterized protein n=1 Tax=Pneumocystis jirovecii TaxID=42068 RepID=L0P7U5_PNEJI|nr:unnamed protein product [Pneumocystis jirovecii]
MKNWFNKWILTNNFIAYNLTIKVDTGYTSFSTFKFISEKLVKKFKRPFLSTSMSVSLFVSILISYIKCSQIKNCLTYLNFQKMLKDDTNKEILLFNFKKSNVKRYLVEYFKTVLKKNEIVGQSTLRL